eukprot:4213317-Pleurochrysis_carterae.AAC.2
MSVQCVRRRSGLNNRSQLESQLVARPCCFETCMQFQIKSPRFQSLPRPVCPARIRKAQFMEARARPYK